MEALESAVLAWIAARHSAHASVLESQLEAAKVVGRTFTAGGAFVTFEVGASAPALPAPFTEKFTALDGPSIDAPELESGASTILHIDINGLISSLEIWAHAGSYPIDRHPAEFALSAQTSNAMDLR